METQEHIEILSQYLEPENNFDIHYESGGDSQLPGQ